MTFATPKGFSHRKHHVATWVTLVVLFWAVAAALVMGVQEKIGPVSPIASVAVKVAVIVLAALAYIELTAHDATVDHAIVVGMAWLLLALMTEIGEATRLGHGWYELLGTPAHSVSRHIVIFTWLVAPALFARARS
ncbi:MAG: hypothetical protein ABI837_14790 [Acidobacteriota bacterium]